MIRVGKDIFGCYVNPITKVTETVHRYTIFNTNQMSVSILTLGAIVSGLKVPDADGEVDDVALGFDDVAGYLRKNNPYIGATVGRVCGRVCNGRFKLGANEYSVSKNFLGKHQLHGGFIGFDRVHWEVIEEREDGISLKHVNPDGHEGFPGEVTVVVHFTLTEDNCLRERIEAETTKPTPLNITNHAYFNLAGHDAGKEALYEHCVMIKADKITEKDAETIPTGRILDVQGTPYDLRYLKNVGEGLDKLLPNIGYDDNFVLELKNNQLTYQAKAYHPNSGRWMEIYSNQPGMHFYTSNVMPDPEKGDSPIMGKRGAEYSKQGSFCLETQQYPDAINKPHFPSVVLVPGDKYVHEVIYKFGAQRGLKQEKHRPEL